MEQQNEAPRIADQFNLLSPEQKIKQYTYLQEIAFHRYYTATTEKRRKEMEELHDFYGMKIAELEKEKLRQQGESKFMKWFRMLRRGA